MPELRTYSQAYVDICGSHPEADVGADSLWAAKRGAFLSRLYIEQGWKEYPWTSGKPSPMPRKKCYGVWDWDWEVLPSRHLMSHWFDHPYRLVNKARGREIFRVEPYGISKEALADLAWISERGWDVDIDANKALHFPGETIAISFEKEHHDGS